MSKYLVTGGAGFIGSSTTEKLVSLGHEVKVLDNLSSGCFENIAALQDRITFTHGDLSDFGIVRDAVDGVEYIIHMAALPSVPLSIQDPIKCNENSVTTSVNLFKAAVDAKSVRRIVQASSSAVYGDSPILPKKEKMLPAPLSPYAAAKLAQEYYAEAFSRVYGLEMVSLRYFNVFGPKQDIESAYSAVIPRFILAMLKGEQPAIFGDGLTSRDFVYIQDVVDANILACSVGLNRKHEVFNIGCGKSITLHHLVDSINTILGTGIVPKYENRKVGDILSSQADISKARNELGFCPKISIEEGLEKLIEYLKCSLQIHRRGEENE